MRPGEGPRGITKAAEKNRFCGDVSVLVKRFNDYQAVVGAGVFQVERFSMHLSGLETPAVRSFLWLCCRRTQPRCEANAN